LMLPSTVKGLFIIGENYISWSPFPYLRK
jgi:hypothetical protein